MVFQSVFSKVKAGLSKTRESFAQGLTSMLRGRPLDESVIADLEARLIQSDVGVPAAIRLVDSVRAAWRAGKLTQGDEVIAHLQRELEDLWPDQDRRLQFADKPPTVILVVGVNGVGKTTSVAKIAKTLRDDNRSVLLAACDTYRAGAIQQLEVWAARLGVQLIRGKQGGDPAAVAYDACDAALARGVEVLLIDTAGRMHTEAPLMRQLSKIREIVARKVPGAPHETLLVLDATTGQNAVRQAEEFHQAVNLSGIFLAKLDGTARGGVIIAIHDAVGVPVKLIGIGERPEDVQAFVPQAVVKALFAEE